MVLCGHQLRSSDHSDWLLSSSAVPIVGGISTATEIITNLMGERSQDGSCENLASFKPQINRPTSSLQPAFFQSRKIKLVVAEEREIKHRRQREGRVSANSAVSSFYDFTGFDESEHYEGCPMKWLYRRQSSSSIRSTATSTIFRSYKRETPNSTVRDKTPREIQIRKIGLKNRKLSRKKQKTDRTASSHDFTDKESCESRNEEHRVKLAAKLNYRDFNKEEDDSSDHDSRWPHQCVKVEKSKLLIAGVGHHSTYHVEGEEKYRNLPDKPISLQNYLPPRPLTGAKPYLYVLLAPRTDNCCSIPPIHRKSSLVEISRSPIVSIRSLSLPQIVEHRPKTTPLCTSATRWAGKKRSSAAVEQKYLQSPTPLTIKLRDETEDKTAPQAVEDVMKEPTFIEDDKYFRLRRFLNLEQPLEVNKSEISKSEEKIIVVTVVSKTKKSARKRPKPEHFEVICNKANFFERPGKPMR